MNEVMRYIDEANHLIKDDEWFNIPAPIRVTCEGIISFSEKLARMILQNGDTTSKKTVDLDTKQKKSESVLK